MDGKTWELWQTLRDSKLLSPRLKQKLDAQTSTAKFYSLRETASGFLTDAHAYYIHTAEYVRGWMWCYDTNRKLLGKEGPASLTQRDYLNLQSLQNKYRVGETHINHPELFTWYEVSGFELAGMMPLSSKMDTFEYHGPTPQILRELALDTFSLQLAELLH